MLPVSLKAVAGARGRIVVMGELRALIPIERALLSTCTALACDEARDHDDLHAGRVQAVLRDLAQSPLDVQASVIDGPLALIFAAAGNFIESFDAQRGVLLKERLHARRIAKRDLRHGLTRFFVERSDLDFKRAGIAVARQPAVGRPEARHG